MASYRFTGEVKEFEVDSIDAETAGLELARIHSEHGRLTPYLVVNEARPEDAPLHPAFEWRDDIAAEEFRRVQARSLIKTVEVIKPDKDDRPTEPAYVKVASSPARYEPPAEVVKSPQMFESAFLQACERLRAAERAMEQLQQIAKRERPDAFTQCGKAVYVLRQLQAMLPKR
jgi:hypothetical protein